MGFMAAITERVQIGSAIIPFFTRTPSLLAMTAVGLDNLSNGRAILGLGASGPQVIEGFHGIPYDAPMQRTREVIEICRRAWTGESLRFEGKKFTIPLPKDQGMGMGRPIKLANTPTDGKNIPIHIAALGPKNVQMTAELAEGWLPLHFWPEKAKDVWADDLKVGLSKRSADLPPLDIAAGGSFAIGEDLKELQERVRPYLAFYFGGMGAKGKNFYYDLLCRYGFEHLADPIQEAWIGGRRGDAVRLIPDELVQQTSLIGPASFVKERLAAYKEAGCTIINLNPVGPNGVKDIETAKEWLS
jgi:F420-dependent oxidoreductase-like protein